MLNRIICWLLCGLFVSFVSAERPPDQLRVLTYNIHHGAGTDQKIDLERIAQTIRSVDPDLVFLQEVDRTVTRSGSIDQASQLAKLTGLQAIFGANIDLQGGQYGNALLTRLPLIEHRNHRLPNLDQGEQRGLIEAKVWFFGMPLKVFGTHFDHRRDDRERVASAVAVNARVSSNANAPAILAGDINATRETTVLETLTKHWTIAGPELPTIPSSHPTRQIDFVFFRTSDQWKVIKTKVLEEPIASDHRPIFTVLQWIESDTAKRQRLENRRQILSTTDQNGERTLAESSDQWQMRAAAIRYGMEAVMGRLPSRQQQPPNVTVLQEVDCGSYVRKKIIYHSESTSQTPAYLCIPKPLLEQNSVPAPAILCLHPTDNKVGHDVVVGLGGKPNRQYASELAERGYVTLSPSYPQLADYQPDLQTLGWESGTLKAVWDNIRGIDLLQSLPFVRKDAIGAIGHSLGGHNAVYTAAHDTRIKAIISSCGLDLYQDYYGGDPARWMPGQGWTQTRYMPRLAHYRNRLEDIPFDFHELVALLAPRHVLVVAPLHDSNFRVESVRQLTTEAGKVFALHGQPDRLIVHHPDCQHDFPIEMRQAAYEMLDSTFSHAPPR